MIADWTAAELEGNPAEAPRTPEFTEGWQLGPPDLIVEAPQAFTLLASGTDVYWNFVLSPKVTKTRYVRAIEIRLTAKEGGASRQRGGGPLALGPRTGSLRPARASAEWNWRIGAAFSIPTTGTFLFWKPGVRRTWSPMVWRGFWTRKAILC